MSKIGRKVKGFILIPVLIAVVLVVLLLLTFLPSINLANVDNSILFLQGKGYWVLAKGECYPEAFIPCTDGTQDLGTASKRWRSIYLSSPTIYLGAVELSNSAQQLDIDGQLIMHDAGKVWIEVQPDLDYNSVQAHGKPTQIARGVHQGFSLPIYAADNEELFVNLDVLAEWDGITNPIIHIHCYLTDANNSKKFKMVVEWDGYSPPTNETVTANKVTVETETTCIAVSPAFTSYEVEFILDYDDSPANPLIACDELGIRLARSAASADEIAGEVVITHIGIKFLRDKLGEVSP